MQPDQRVDTARDIQALGQVTGDLCGLVETAGLEPVRMQRHGHDEFRPGLIGRRPCAFKRLRQTFGKKTSQIKMVAVFEIADQRIDRKVVSPDRTGGVKERAMMGTVRAVFKATGHWQGAAVTARCRQQRQISGAVRADRVMAAGQIAQGAGLGEQCISHRTRDNPAPPGDEVLHGSGIA